MSIFKALEALAEIRDSVNEAGYNCKCANVPTHLITYQWVRTG